MFTMIKSSKCSKVLFIGLIVTICVPLFALSVGASENLVPTDMRQWETINAVGSSSITYYAGGQGNEITLTPSNNIYFVGLASGVDYIAGHTYNLTFGSSYNEVQHLTWGFGYRTGEDTFQFLSSSNSITTSNKMSFVAPDTVNSVYVIFVFDGTTRQNIQINHLLCVDVTASEQQAVIDNANENTNRIGRWFADLSDKITEVFTELFAKIKALFSVKTERQLNWHSGFVSGGKFYLNSTITNQWLITEPFSGNAVVSYENLSKFTRFRVYKLSSDEDISTDPSYMDFGALVGYSDYLGTSSFELTDGYYYIIQVNLTGLSTGQYANFLNENVTVKVDQFFVNYLVDSIKNQFTRLANLVLYFNADGIYTNPFTFGNIEGVNEYVTHIQGAFDGFNDGINDFVAPIGVVNAVLDEVVGEWGFVAVAVTFVLSALVLIRFLGV